MRGAIVYSGVEALYCLDLSGLSVEDSDALVGRVQNTMKWILREIRRPKSEPPPKGAA
jgi:hypothetical protein